MIEKVNESECEKTADMAMVSLLENQQKNKSRNKFREENL